MVLSREIYQSVKTRTINLKIIIINFIYTAQFDTNDTLTALYTVKTYIQMQRVHIWTYMKQSYSYTCTCLHKHTHQHIYKYTEGSRPEWRISTIYHNGDTPFWSGTPDIYIYIQTRWLILLLPAFVDKDLNTVQVIYRNTPKICSKRLKRSFNLYKLEQTTAKKKPTKQTKKPTKKQNKKPYKKQVIWNQYFWFQSLGTGILALLQDILSYFEGFWPEWYTFTIIYSQDIPFWS